MGGGVRIIAGTAGRVAIRVPKGETRPTTDFVRQAVFSRLGEVVEGARVLDLFAGSGALGLEALSRGGKECVFVDEGRASEQAIRANLQKSRLSGGRVVRADVHGWLRRERSSFDLVFADPPYCHSALDRDHLGAMFALEGFADRVAPDGFLIAEQSAREVTREAVGFELVDRREYGSSAILLYARRSDS
ncbi:16S rRNA (guanine(966)-N(2))-methyltransferase RsmD [Haloferula rosea]|uniref:16S rRNA (Guanine(966)-N(2))-methyltransferase RsmD n=1 Tax=Haloferula rosea TaxID=490093 RepID=A0A934RAE0_9BACT|nr:16S rRNA (guanine(966)-N(2))-methyltransferase RsmD [Haloferula rosea]